MSIASIATQPDGFQEYTILIIDDNPTNLAVVVNYLKEFGFDIMVARNGEIGLKRAQMTCPDIILLDVMMPGIDGFETCSRLKANESTCDIPVIFMTALDSTEDKVKGFEVGGVDYVTKPIQQEEILARITTHLRIRDLTLTLNAKIDELLKTRHELVQSEKMASLGRLVAGFAHELNTPVGIAVGAASTLQNKVKLITKLLEQEEVDEDDLVSALNIIKQTAELTLSNLKRAANLMKSFKRTAIDQTSEKLKPFLVKELISDVINLLHSSFKSTHIEIQVDCSDQLAIYGLPGTLEQILTNLMINSLVHGFEEGKNAGHIVIAIHLKGEHLHLAYSDTGKGIAPENMENIFEPFFTTHRTHGGSGLGLYICYNLITSQLKGTINCESTLGKGVVFRIEFPVTIKE